MNGPEHYQEADRILREDIPSAVDLAQGIILRGDMQAIGAASTMLQALLDKAQVHATLAQAAATALSACEAYYGDESKAVRAWATLLESERS